MRTTPHRYYVSPRLTVDEHRGDRIAVDDAVTLMQTGSKVCVRDEETARGVLSAFGMSQDEVDSAIRFGQTGRV